MNKQIRRGVFETNSSSTHSMQITNGSLEDAYKYVSQRIAEKYSNLNDENKCDINDYITKLSDGTYELSLKGLYFNDGDEEKCIYYIINSWLGKVQYLAQIINDNIHKTPEYIKYIEEYSESIESINKKYAENCFMSYYHSDEYQKIKDKCPIISDTLAYKALTNAIIKTSKEHGVEVSNVVLNNLLPIYCLEYDVKEKSLLALFDNDKLLEEELVKILHNDNVKLYYIDEAYSPYEKPEIYVY